MNIYANIQIQTQSDYDFDLKNNFLNVTEQEHGFLKPYIVQEYNLKCCINMLFF